MWCWRIFKRKKVNEISVDDFKTSLEEGADFQIIDVREPYEFEIANLGGTLIPLSTIEDNFHKISKNKKVILHCRSGKRSADAIRKLQKIYPFKNLFNLKGGILEYSNKIDPTIPTY